MSLLPEKRIDYSLDYFPTRWQAVIFRNYGLVDSEIIAKILKTDKNVIELEAKRLGLGGLKSGNEWQKNGYVTLIRSNWHLLDFKGLQTLTGLSERELAYALKEDDFLDVKLGEFKPEVVSPKYEPLFGEQIKKTEKIKKTVEKIRKRTVKNPIAPFDFFSPTYYSCKTDKKLVKFGNVNAIIYDYCANYGDIFVRDEPEGFSDKILSAYKNAGVNGIWLQGVLSALSYYPFVPALSEKYELRRKNLNKLIEKCAKYGIKIYLYINEPRSLPNEFFETRPELKGQTIGAYSALCTSVQAVKDYLYEAIKDLASNVKGLGGFITITMSENLTHCNSIKKTDCPRCAVRPKYELPAEVNNIIMKAVRDAKSSAKVYANLWAWSFNKDFSDEDILKGIAMLDKEINVLSVSENEMRLTDESVQDILLDYSISRVGPSEKTIFSFNEAKKTGHEISAKVQINNSWELASVPYIPVFELIYEHMTNLKNVGVNDVMLSWTVGGYPSVSIALAIEILKNKEFDMNEWYCRSYGEKGLTVRDCVKKFSAAFRKFPFSVCFLYFGCQNVACANPLFLKNSGLAATMVGFPYDDIESWRGSYPMDLFELRLKELCNLWLEGLDSLKTIKSNKKSIKELKNIAEACYIHFRTTYLQLTFNRKKADVAKNSRELIAIANEEYKLCRRLFVIAQTDARIGYEPSNQYFYYSNLLLEKAVNVEYVLTRLKKSRVN